MSFENEAFEIETSDATTAGKRSAFDVLESLSGNPFKQAEKLVQYLESSKERQAKLVKKCSEAALKLVNENCPGLIA
ncbi:MAG TPA: hypothetical protein VIY48_11005 [Candidatus Paceibacterota bacterium]